MAPDNPQIIEENPIGKGLDVFRASFKSAYTDSGGGILCLPEALDQLNEEGLVRWFHRNVLH